MENDEEIIKYREENQMDYIKAITLLHENPDNPIYFETIYRITRLHIPNIAYKYISFNEDDTELNRLKLRTLSDQKIFLSAPTFLNDPFEAKAFFYRREELQKFDRLKHCNGNFIDNFANFVVQSSFTSKGINCMPMWAHYTNNHKGFCVAYNLKDYENTKLAGNMMRVQYVEERLDVTEIMKDIVSKMINRIEESIMTGNKQVIINDLTLVHMVSFLTCMKHISWSYESELRCITASNAKCAPLIEAKPESIYIGANCAPGNRKHLIDIGDMFDIPVYDMVFDEYSHRFEHIAKRINS